jgi:hypothetical protein
LYFRALSRDFTRAASAFDAVEITCTKKPPVLPERGRAAGFSAGLATAGLDEPAISVREGVGENPAGGAAAFSGEASVEGASRSSNVSVTTGAGGPAISRGGVEVRAIGAGVAEGNGEGEEDGAADPDDALSAGDSADAAETPGGSGPAFTNPARTPRKNDTASPASITRSAARPWPAVKEIWK